MNVRGGVIFLDWGSVVSRSNGYYLYRLIMGKTVKDNCGQNIKNTIDEFFG